MPVSCLVFDIDDTLYLERDYVKSGFRWLDRWLRRERSIEGFFDVAWGLFENGLRGRIFNAALEEIGKDWDETLIAEMVERYRTHDPDIRLLPDVREILPAVQRLGAAAVLTDGPVSSQTRKADALGLARFSEPIVFTWKWGRRFGKPHERGFRYIQEQTGYPGAECVYVADNPTKDFVAPKALGWHTVRVRRAGSLHEDMDSGPDVDMEIQTLTQLEWLNP